MTTNFYSEVCDELYHHGIKGQKWGERNGPPYPLSSMPSKESKKLAKKTGSGVAILKKPGEKLTKEDIKDLNYARKNQKKIRSAIVEDMSTHEGKYALDSLKNYLLNKGNVSADSISSLNELLAEYMYKSVRYMNTGALSDRGMYFVNTNGNKKVGVTMVIDDRKRT